VDRRGRHPVPTTAPPGADRRGSHMCAGRAGGLAIRANHQHSAVGPGRGAEPASAPQGVAA
jgi:hypothetical protein